MRFTFISLELSPGSFNINLFIKHFLIDSYIVYTFYNHEYVFRKIYESFVAKKEELLKFKEMIAESLPQSLVVVTYASNDLLFSNKSFHSIFGASDNTKQLKKDLESLVVDHSTIRDTDSNNKSFSFSIESNAPLSLTETIEKLSSKNYLSDKTISLTASTTQNETRRLFEVTLKKVKWDSEDAIAVFFNDITYQENLIALKMANVNKDKVIATVSHELRTPLNGIIGILDITEKKVEDPQVARYLSLCKDNAHLLLSLVNSILDFHQISADKLQLNPVDLNVRKVVSSIAQLFYFQCKEKNILFEYDIHQDVPARIKTDENRFKQVLINLVANAIKFTQKGGVKLEVIPHPKNHDSLQVSVTDTGIGIKTEDQKRLFKMYSKIEDGESVNKNGVGLGLTISNALVIMLNDGVEGRGIAVDSEYGKGSRFYFEIQKHLKEKEKKKAQPIKNEISSEAKKPFLVALNDSDTARAFLTQNNKICEELKTEEARLDSEENCQDEYTESLDLQSKLANYTSPTIFDTHIISKQGTRNLQPEEGKDQDRAQPGDTLNFTNRHKSESGMAAIKTNLNILIVDDNPFNLLVAKSLFQEFGCNIVTALGGQEAIDLVVENCSEGKPFDIIFMDCQMPIMDGFETTKALKIMTEKGEIPEVSIFGWTANNSEEDVKRCYEAGMIGHLPKPSSKMDFLKAISQL